MLQHKLVNLLYSHRFYCLLLFFTPLLVFFIIKPVYLHADSFDVAVYLNEEEVGKSFVLMQENSEEVLINSKDMQEILQDFITEDKVFQVNKWFEDLPAYSNGCEIPPFFFIKFDDFSQTIQMIIDLSFLKRRVLDCDRKTASDKSKKIVGPANWSGYLNLRYSSGVGYYYVPDFEADIEPHHLISNFNIQHANWSFTGSFDPFNTHCRRNQRRVRDLLLITDWPERKIRSFIGEFAPPVQGTIQNSNVLGIGITKNSFFFGDEDKGPVQTYDFFLPKSSTVDLFVNQILYQTYNLPAGPHSLKNLPILPGNNQISLKVRDDFEWSGKADLEYFYDPTLLPPGEFSWGTSFGFPQNLHQNSYLWKEPTLTGYYSYGVTPSWTSGIYFQNSYIEGQFGSENAFVTKHFKALFDLGGIWLYKGKLQPRCRLFLQNIPTHKDAAVWYANLQYLGKRCCLRRSFYSYQDYINFNNYVQFSALFNVSKRLYRSCCGNLGFNYYLLKENQNKWGCSGSISFSITKTILANLMGYISCVNPSWHREGGCVFSITWNPSNSNFQGNFVYDSYRQSYLSSLNYNKNLGGHSSIGANIGIDHQEDSNSFIGSMNYQGERFEMQGSNYAALHQNRNGNHINGRSGFMVATSLVFADGVFGISRPIYDSFIMMKQEHSLKGFKIGANPMGEGNYVATTLGPLPAVISQVNSYSPTSVVIGSEELPLGFELEHQYYCCLPKFKSGTLLKIKETGTYFVEGRLVDSSNKPLTTVFGMLKLQSEEERCELSFFTDRSGYFQIIGLKRGHFDLYIDQEKTEACIEIPSEAMPGFYDIGDISVEIAK